MFTQKDLRQIKKKGILLDDINRHIKYFQQGFPPADITRPATPGKGIMVLTEGEEQHYKDVFLANAPDFHITRFIPASGAASRMFKSLYTAMEKLEGKSVEQQWKWIEKKKELRRFFKNLEKYPFYEDLNTSKKDSPHLLLRKILTEKGIAYGSQPKGLLKFHKYDARDRRTAFEEHMLEAVKYCGNRQGEINVHLTVSESHLEGFQKEARSVLPRIEKEKGMHIKLSFSFQKPETDTLAVDLENQAYRSAYGSLVFRPGGHGALIKNLDALNSDIIFISNVDNVAPDHHKNLRVKFKQILCGILLETRSKVFYYLHQLNSAEKLERTRLESMAGFLQERMGIAIPDLLDSWDAPELRQWLISTMNRPIRVCGMVRNEGEPGGGPFYVRNDSGEVSLQIVESSQIDLQDVEKAEIVRESTHFNPVDLVCGTRDYLGKKFHLERYVDLNTGFISEKSQGGDTLKALELPGLWNGAMAKWLTLFVEVPIETFSPVKTVFDLMRKEHRTA